MSWRDHPPPRDGAGRLIVVPECDSPTPPSVYFEPTGDGRYRCRCVVCPRCAHHTGNNVQGHYWSTCSAAVRAGVPLVEATGRVHFCCPGSCELEGEVWRL